MFVNLPRPAQGVSVANRGADGDTIVAGISDQGIPVLYKSQAVNVDATLGAQGALFEQGARHVGMDIRGKDVANPTAILFASVMLLRYLKMPNFADRMEAAGLIERLKSA